MYEFVAGFVRIRSWFREKPDGTMLTLLEIQARRVSSEGIQLVFRGVRFLAKPATSFEPKSNLKQEARPH